MKMVENSTFIGGPIFPPWWWKFSTPNMMVEKSTLSNTTLKGGKIHHPPTKGGKCSIYVNLCTIHGTGIAFIVMQLIVWNDGIDKHEGCKWLLLLACSTNIHCGPIRFYGLWGG